MLGRGCESVKVNAFTTEVLQSLRILPGKTTP